MTGNNAIGYKVLDQIIIDCEDLCKDLEQKLESEDDIIGVFKHSDEKIILVGFASD